MLANSVYARPRLLWRYGNSLLGRRLPVRYLTGNLRSAIRGFTRASVPRNAIRQVGVRASTLGRVKVPIHHSYVSYAPVAAPSAAKFSLASALFSTTIGKVIVGLTIGAIATAIVVGTAVPVSLRSASSASTSNASPASQASEQYIITFNTSNVSIPVGDITDAGGLAYLQTQLDNITAQYASQLSPCRLQLSKAEETSDRRIITSVTLQCNVFCTGTCAQQKSDALRNITSTNAQTFVITDFPVASNRSLRLARSVLPLERNEKAAPGTIIDGRRVAGTNGLVTSVSFYVDQSCVGHSIQFGAFEMNHHEGVQAEFTVTAESGPIVVSKIELPSSSSKQ